MTKPGTNTFRPPSTVTLPGSAALRPSGSSVGSGPIGLASFDEGPYVNQTAHAGMDGLSSLLQWSTSFFDWLVTQYTTSLYAEALTAQVHADRQFDLTKKARSAYTTAEEIAAHASEFFGKPFSGALVAWNVYTQITAEVIPLVTYDPMVVLGYADEGQATGFEEKSTSRTMPPLRYALSAALNPVATIEKVAWEQCCTRYYLLDMPTVLLSGSDPSYWRMVADQTKDLRGPCLVDRFVEYLTPKPSKII